MDTADLGRIYQDTLGSILLFEPSGNEVVFPISINEAGPIALSRASVWMKNISDYQIVLKVDISNPNRYQCSVGKFAILDGLQEVKLALIRLGRDPAQRDDVANWDNSDGISVPREVKSESIRISAIVSPKMDLDTTGVPGKSLVFF